MIDTDASNIGKEHFDGNGVVLISNTRNLGSNFIFASIRLEEEDLIEYSIKVKCQQFSYLRVATSHGKKTFFG